jgi:hypothetical protein
VGYVTAEQVLGVGVHRVVLDNGQFLLEHPANRVATAPTDPHNLDSRRAIANLRHQAESIAGIVSGLPQS